MALWRRLIQGTEWSHLGDMVSPTLFEVVPATAVVRQATQMAQRLRGGKRFAAVKESRAGLLERHGVPVRIGGTAPNRSDAPSDSLALVGQAVLQLYFHQIQTGGATLLDLRPKSFRPGPDHVCWNPGSLWIEWDRGFRHALVDVYAGFYRDQPETFQRGLRHLGVESAADIFREQFGDGDQSSVTFEVARFVDIFHRVFVRCREAGARLPDDFVSFGLYLAGLYDHLESVGLPLDVRGAYLSATTLGGPTDE